MPEYPWMAIARGEVGQQEIPGPEHNERVLEYLQSTTLGTPDNQRDETPWCSAFVNFCVNGAGYQGTDSAWARSWLGWGQEAQELQPGVVVVLKRGKSSGHVGFWIDEDESSVCLFGGNQNDSVCEAWFSKDRVLGYREPAE